MAENDPHFQEQFSALMNALQRAALLAGKQATDARLATVEADSLYRAVHDAVEAARSMRPNGQGEA